MKKSVFFSFAVIAVILILVGSACSFSSKIVNSKTQEPEVVIVTATPKADVPVITEAPVEVTEEPTAEEPLRFYREEFDGDIDNFTISFTGSGDSEKAEINQEDGKMKFNQDGENIYSYVYYEPYTYTDVKIDVEVENLGTNDNSVNIVCRYDEDLGWYEYNIDNDGEWNLWFFDRVVYKGYRNLYDGGSTAIHMGRDTNTYTVVCQGDELTLYINGVLTHTVKNNDLKEGKVGFGVSSYFSYPVLMNVNWFEISEP